MKTLAEIQAEMQRAILGGNNHATALLAPPPHGDAGRRLKVYQSAYGLRLTEFLANDYEKLLSYLGDVRFRTMAEAYIRAHPSDHPNARWFSRHLPEFLKSDPKYRRNPEVAEMALLERALNAAFDGPDAPVVTMAELARVPGEQVASARFDLAPTVFRIPVSTNVTSLWSSLRCGVAPPAPEDLARPCEVLVWRQAGGSRFRLLGDEEAMALACVGDGVSFSHICEMIAVSGAAEDAAVRAAGYLRGWIEAEIISCIRLTDDGAK